ncbi:MAG: hypothetical protein V2I51_07295 [Anderseniella sp.]|jgi:hypothetical protein|nr:hypothetical protein [Anderseniella sp.]
MRTVCKAVTGIYVALCVASLLAIPFGGGALSGVFAGMLAMPWLHILTNLMGDTSGNITASFALAGAGMGLNAAILWYGCQWLATGKIKPDAS